MSFAFSLRVIEAVFVVTEHLPDSQLALESPVSSRSQVSDPCSQNRIRLAFLAGSTDDFWSSHR